MNCSTASGPPSCRNSSGEEITCPTWAAENCNFPPPPPSPPPPTDSCEGRCGVFDANQNCQCDYECYVWGDCCADFAELCQ